MNSGAYGALELDPEDAFEAEVALAGLGVRRSSFQPLGINGSEGFKKAWRRQMRQGSKRVTPSLAG